MESYRRDRLTPWELSVLFLRAGKVEPGAAVVPAMFVSLLFAIAAIWVGVTAARSLVPVPIRAFFALALVSTGATSLMASFELRRGEALRFLRIAPEPAAGKWLLFLPFGGAGILIAVAALAWIPPLATVALLGCWCWAAVIGHWCAGRGLHILVAGWLLSLVPLVVAAFSCGSGGWAPAAATAGALASIGWLASPRDPLLTLRAGIDAASEVSGARRVRHSRRRRTALRMFLLSEVLSRRGWSLFMALGLLFVAVVVFCLPLSAMNGCFPMVACAGFMGTANTPAIRDFLAIRPISPGQKLRGLILPWCLLAVVIPAAALLRASTATSIDRRQIAQLVYPRDVVRAAASPAAGDRNDPVDEVPISPALRHLFLGQVGRISLLELACFASAGAWNLSHARVSRRRRQRSMNAALFAVSFALMFPFLYWRFRSWTPEFWLVTPVTALGVWALVRELAQLDAGRRV